MGFRFRKSVSLGKGVRLNFSKRGIGVSVGVRGARWSIGPSGPRVTLGIPGTGLYYEHRLGRGRRRRVAAAAPDSSSVSLGTSGPSERGGGGRPWLWMAAGLAACAWTPYVGVPVAAYGLYLLARRLRSPGGRSSPAAAGSSDGQDAPSAGPDPGR